MTDFVRNRLDKAGRAIAAARRELAADEPEFAAGHAYYAMFYTTEALLTSRELTFSSHGAVHGAFGKEFVKSGELDPKFHQWLLAAFRERQEATYGAEVEIPAEHVETLIRRADEFLTAARKHLGIER